MSNPEISTEKVLAMIAESVADVGADRAGTEAIAFSESMPLFGAGSPLDSLEFACRRGVPEACLRKVGVDLLLNEGPATLDSVRAGRSQATLARRAAI